MAAAPTPRRRGQSAPGTTGGGRQMSLCGLQDSGLPKVDDTQVICPGCGQSLAEIGDSERHYKEPTLVQVHGTWTATRTTVGTNRGAAGMFHDGPEALCPYDGDYLTQLVFRAQVEASRKVSA